MRLSSEMPASLQEFIQHTSDGRSPGSPFSAAGNAAQRKAVATSFGLLTGDIGMLAEICRL